MSNPYLTPNYYLPPPNPYHPAYAPPPNTHRYSRSWHAPNSPGYATAALPSPLTGQNPPFVPLQPSPPGPPIYPRSRRHSFDNSYLQSSQAYPFYPGSYSSFYPPPLPHPSLHALLNGDALPQYLYADLSAHALSPHRRAGPTGQLVPLTRRDFEQAATSPSMVRLKIVCDAIPQWPIELQVVGTTLRPHVRDRPAIPFITVGDVLQVVHQTLHQQITHDEWGVLSDEQETQIARAYTRRYKAFAPVERQQRRDGVKRVDFLLRNYHFKGLTWLDPDVNGVERMKLLVGPP